MKGTQLRNVLEKEEDKSRVRLERLRADEHGILLCYPGIELDSFGDRTQATKRLRCNRTRTLREVPRSENTASLARVA